MSNSKLFDYYLYAMVASIVVLAVAIICKELIWT